jgi:hypothetical protein
MWMTDGLSVVRVIFSSGVRSSVQSRTGNRGFCCCACEEWSAGPPFFSRSSIPTETGTRGALRAFLCKVRVLGCKRPSLFGLLQAQAEQLQLKSEMSQAPTAAMSGQGTKMEVRGRRSGPGSSKVQALQVLPLVCHTLRRWCLRHWDQSKRS